MGLLDALRAGVKAANTVTKDLQADVMYEEWLGDDGFGNDDYAPPRPIKALVDWQQKQVRTLSGVLSVSRARIQILDPNIVVDDHDHFILPDGTTGPILDMDGFIDRGTGHPVATGVYIG